MTSVAKSDSTRSREFPSGPLGAVTRKKREIEELLHSPEANKEKIKLLFNVYLEKVERLLEACNELREKEDCRRDALEEWLEPILTDISQFRSDVEKLFVTSHDVRTASDVRSHASRASSSKVSTSRASGSSVTSARVALAQQKAKLMAEKSALKETMELEKEEMELQRKELELQARIARERLVLKQKKREAEMRKVELETDILEDELKNVEGGERSYNGSSGSEASAAHALHVDPPKQGQSPAGDLLAVALAKQNELTQLLAESHERAVLPKRQLHVFDGSDLTVFRTFLTAFENLFEKACTSDSDKLAYLGQYTAGKARKLVDSCNHYDASAGYKKAKLLLKEEYGNELKIANSFLTILNDWPSIDYDNSDALDELSLFLTKCSNYMLNMSSLNHLNSPKEIMNIITKLPYRLRERWRTYTYRLTKNAEDITFQHLVTFVHEESAILKQPIFADIKGSAEKKVNTGSGALKKRSLSTKTANVIDEGPEVSQMMCPCCKKNNHHLTNCFFFKRKPTGEKMNIVKKLGLCFGCLRANHLSKDCRNRLTCAKCGRQHPTVLHETIKSSGPVQRTDGSPASAPTSSGAESAETRHQGTSFATGAGVCPGVKVRCPVTPGENKFG